MNILQRLISVFSQVPLHVLSIESIMTARHLRINPVTNGYEEIGKRVVANKKVTDAFVADIVDGMVAESWTTTFHFHDSGTGVVAENQTDTTLGTPCAEARDDGTHIEGASANIFKTVATHTYAGSFAITEHGVFDQLASGGILMDRSVFSAINVVATDKIEFTYNLTLTAGG